MNPDEDQSFKHDRNARSFRPKDFGLGDVPWILVGLVAVVGVVAGFGYLFDVVGQVLPPNVRLVAIGFALGFLVGVRVNSRTTRPTHPAPPLSDLVKEIARDPQRKIEAIKAYRDDTGAGLAEAKEAVETFIRSL